MDKTETRYDIETDVMFPQATHIDVAGIAAATQPWWNRTLTQKHDEEDEFFFVLEGRLDIELEDRTVSLGPQEGFTVSKGVMHFPHARGRVVVLMVEKGSVVPTGS